MSDDMRQILRWTVPIDGQPHQVPAGIVHVGFKNDGDLSVWTCPSNAPDLVVTVVGTGHPYPKHWKHLGSAVTPSGVFVWHLMATGAQPEFPLDASMSSVTRSNDRTEP